LAQRELESPTDSSRMIIPYYSFAELIYSPAKPGFVYQRRDSSPRVR
jgi:hypothetical protein